MAGVFTTASSSSPPGDLLLLLLGDFEGLDFGGLPEEGTVSTTSPPTAITGLVEVGLEEDFLGDFGGSGGVGDVALRDAEGEADGVDTFLPGRWIPFFSEGV